MNTGDKRTVGVIGFLVTGMTDGGAGIGIVAFQLKAVLMDETVPPDAYSTGLSYIPSFFELRCKGTYLWGFCKFSSSFFVLIMSFFLLICVTCCFVVDYQLL